MPSPRFFSLMRLLDFLTEIHDDAQLLARKCSYVIWLNRYNKDFQPMRITGAESSDITGVVLKATTFPLSADEKKRAAQNLEVAR